MQAPVDESRATDSWAYQGGCRIGPEPALLYQQYCSQERYQDRTPGASPAGRARSEPPDLHASRSLARLLAMSPARLAAAEPARGTGLPPAPGPARSPPAPPNPRSPA